MELDQRSTARLALVREHVKGENEHDLNAIMAPFGTTARYDDEPCEEHFVGRDAVRSHYEDLFRAVPDLHIDVEREHVTQDGVVLEVVIRGTQQGTWRGLPATGRSVAVPLCGVFSFDAQDRLAGERVYYDRALVLRQLGVFHEPETLLGQVLTALTHPVTIARIAGRRLTRTFRRT
jgi:steroid delta-isomerase-like uncharacterized protein